MKYKHVNSIEEARVIYVAEKREKIYKAELAVRDKYPVFTRIISEFLDFWEGCLIVKLPKILLIFGIDSDYNLTSRGEVIDEERAIELIL